MGCTRSWDVENWNKVLIHYGKVFRNCFFLRVDPNLTPHN